jgi:hypothetical protein
MLLAYGFGARIYPWIGPAFGGAAVPVGHVTLKPGAPDAVIQVVSEQSVPLFDIDEKFLYVVACPPMSRSDKPEVVMVPLEFLASAAIESADTFLAVPAYLDQQSCTATPDKSPGTSRWR